MSEELKPCPFCGSKPVVEQGKVHYCQLHGDPFQAVIIKCKNSGCPARPKVEDGDIHNGGFHQARDKAASSWNNRAPDDRDELLEKMADALKEFYHCGVTNKNSNFWYCFDGNPANPNAQWYFELERRLDHAMDGISAYETWKAGKQ